MCKSQMWSLWRGLLTAVAMVGLTDTCLPARAAFEPPSSPRPGAPALDDAMWTKRGDAAAEYSAGLSGRAVLIMHQGRVVYERYDNGWSASRPHMLASGTKSFTGVMAMFAVQDGLLTLDELACDTLPEWRDDPRKSKITVGMLLDLSSGLDPADDSIGSAGAFRLQRGRAARKETPAPDDKFAAAIALKAINDPGKLFVYGPSHFYAFGALLERKLEARHDDDPKFPADVTAYLHARIFDPLTIQVGMLGKDKAGHPNLPGGCFLTAREWVKFGEFVRRNGAVLAPTASDPDATKQLLKPDLLAQCFEPSKANRSYGLTWWLPGEAASGGGTSTSEADMPLRDRSRARALRAEAEGHIKDSSGNSIRVFMAAGLGKQRLYVLPDHDLVIVRFAENSTEGRRFDNAEFLKHILGIE